MPPKKGKSDAPSKSKDSGPEKKGSLVGDVPLELFIQCKSIGNKDALGKGEKSDLFVVLSYRENPTGKWSRVGKTETVQNNLSPAFKKTFLFEPNPKVELMLEVHDEDPAKREALGIAHFFLKELTDKPNGDVVKPLRFDKSNKTFGNIALSVKTNAENLAVLEERVKIVKEGGFDLVKEEEEKKLVGEEIKSFVDGSGLPIAFKLVCAEIVEKKIEKEEVYVYAAKRMRELGEQIQKLVDFLELFSK